jgi:pSer/pThr/pTyr-binding forkhead associated (FHA) protein
MDVLLLILRVVLAGLLYAFLGTVLLMLWRDLRATSGQRSTTRSRGRLVVVEAPSGELEAGRSEKAFPLQPVMSVGRSPSNTVVIADTYASSQHALLTWREGQWRLEDRGSRNGTRLNGELIEEPVIVTVDDVIQVGQTKLRLEIGT